MKTHGVALGLIICLSLLGCGKWGEESADASPSDTPQLLTEDEALDVIKALPEVIARAERIQAASNGQNALAVTMEGSSEDYVYFRIWEDTPDVLTFTLDRYWVDRRTGQALLCDPLTAQPFPGELHFTARAQIEEITVWDDEDPTTGQPGISESVEGTFVDVETGERRPFNLETGSMIVDGRTYDLHIRLPEEGGTIHNHHILAIGRHDDRLDALAPLGWTQEVVADLMSRHEELYQLSRDPRVELTLLYDLARRGLGPEAYAAQELWGLHVEAEEAVGCYAPRTADPERVWEYIAGLYEGDLHSSSWCAPRMGGYPGDPLPDNLRMLIELGPQAAPQMFTMFRHEALEVTPAMWASRYPLSFNPGLASVEGRNVTYGELADYALRCIYPGVRMCYHPDLPLEERQLAIARWKAHVFPEAVAAGEVPAHDPPASCPHDRYTGPTVERSSRGSFFPGELDHRIHRPPREAMREDLMP